MDNNLDTHDEGYDPKTIKDFHIRFQAAKRARTDFDSKCDDIDKHYEPWSADWGDDDDGRAHLRTPHIYHQGETLNANMIDPDPSVELTPREQADDNIAKVCSAYVGYAFEHAYYPTKLSQVVRIGNRYGLGVAKTMWNRDEKEVHTPNEPSFLQKVTGGDPGFSTTVEVLENDPNLIVCDLRDIWWNAGATGLHDLTDWFHRSFISLDKLKDLESEGIYHSIDEVGKGGFGDDTTKNSMQPEKQDDRTKQLDKGVELVEWYNLRTRKLHTVANQRVCIRSVDFPFAYGRKNGQIPFAIYRPIPMHDRFEGISPVEPLVPLQENVWIMENQRIDAVTLALNPTLLVDRTLKGSGEFVIRSGGRIWVNRPEQVKQLQIDSQAAQGWSEVQAYLGYMQQVSGVSPFIAGADPGASGINQDTATGVNQLAGAAGRRIDLFRMELESFVKTIARQFLEMAREFLDEPRFVRIVGSGEAEWLQLTGDQVPVAFDLKIKGASETVYNQHKLGEDLNRLNAMSQFEGMPFPDGTQFTSKPLLKKVIDDMGLNADLCFVQTQQHVQDMQQAQVDQAQQAAGGSQDASQAPQNGDPAARLFEQVSYKDLAPDAQAGLLAQMGLPTDGVQIKAQADMAEQQARIAKLQTAAGNANHSVQQGYDSHNLAAMQAALQAAQPTDQTTQQN